MNPQTRPGQDDAPLFTNGAAQSTLSLLLHVTDQDLVTELQTHAEGRAREEYALTALRIGLLALRQARGQVDAETIRRESERLLTVLDQRLRDHSQSLNLGLASFLKDYFDPGSGRFAERLQRLICKDGELEQVMRRHIGETDSELCKTLAAHFGTQSPLMKLLSPTESQGILKALGDMVAHELEAQRNRVLAEFSLDRKESALSRLVSDLTERHGQLNKSLESKLNEVRNEFSLDKDDSALSRLVHRVENAQRLISGEFSLDNDKSALSRLARHLTDTSAAINTHLTLDNDTSALSRLKRELLDVLNHHSESNQKFQEEVKTSLARLDTRRKEEQSSPKHGVDFQQRVFEFVQHESQKVQDIPDDVSSKVGNIKQCKVGDCIVRIGPDAAAAGSSFVIEAKDEMGYSLTRAMQEIETARKNRQCDVGLFVFARRSAPPGLEPFQRLGDDVFVLWDQDDPQSDLYLKAALTVARALCTKRAREGESLSFDFNEIEKAINEIERKTTGLDEIHKSAESIKGQSDKILERVRISREGIAKQINVLRNNLQDLKQAMQCEGE